MTKLPQKERRLQLALKQLPTSYDFILIDCPPALNMLTVNALVAADGVLIPMQCEYYALEGLAGLVSTVEQIQAGLNPRLKIQGIIRTMFDGRNKLALEVSRQLLEHFGGQVFHTVVPRNVRVAEAPSHGLPVVIYDRYSKGSLSYMALAGELLKRVKADRLEDEAHKAQAQEHAWT